MSMRRKLVFLAALAVLPLLFTQIAGAGGGGDNSSGAPASSTRSTGTSVTSDNLLTFSAGFEAHEYTIDVSGGTKVVASTKDCCTAGDHWFVSLINPTGGSTVGALDAAKAKCGSGETTFFTGKAPLGSSTAPISSGTLKAYVGYCSGVDSFPAGVTVRFTYDGPTMTVTQVL